MSTFGQIELEQIYVRVSISKHCQLIAGNFGLVPFSTAYKVNKGLMDQNVLQLVLINSAKYLLKSNLLNIDNIAMSLYDITYV